MSTNPSSPAVAEMARKIESELLRGFAATSGKALALSIGKSESWISRFFNEGDAHGKTEVARIALMIAEMQLSVYPSYYRVSDPKEISALLSVAQMSVAKLDLHHLMKSPAQ